MKLKIRRWFFRKLDILIDGLSHWQSEHDSCELCGVGAAAEICVNCDRRIDLDCESGWYEDAPLCEQCCSTGAGA